MKREILGRLENEFEGLKEIIKKAGMEERELEFDGVSILSQPLWGTRAYDFSNNGFSFSLHSGRKIFLRYQNGEIKEIYQGQQVMNNGRKVLDEDGDSIYNYKNDIINKKVKYAVMIDYNEDDPPQNRNYKNLMIVKINEKAIDEMEKYEKQIDEEIGKYEIKDK